MTRLTRLLCCLVFISFVNFNALKVDHAKADDIRPETQITEHEPKARISNLKDLPEGKSGKWLWVILGVAVVAGGAAAMAGGGDSGGGDGDTDGPTTGSVGGSW